MPSTNLNIGQDTTSCLAKVRLELSTSHVGAICGRRGSCNGDAAGLLTDQDLDLRPRMIPAATLLMGLGPIARAPRVDPRHLGLRALLDLPSLQRCHRLQMRQADENSVDRRDLLVDGAIAAVVAAPRLDLDPAARASGESFGRRHHV